ncbi:MAG: UvrD-helicase domain-containing protein, partial [Colwellia sp.]
MTKWQPTEGIVATNELMDIINCDSSVSVLAGAGAGKTELLAQKANYLLHTDKCLWPKKILCLSFKTEAQANIKNRVNKRCGVKADRFDSYTFHAFSKSIVDRFKNVLPENKRPLNNYDIVMKENQANGLDKVWMGSLVNLAIEIIKSREDVCNLFSMSYSHVFIDEFQDTTNSQYRLLQELFKGKGTILLAVGDINQSIMLWADARTTAFEDFTNDFVAQRKLLLCNYRATLEIQSVLNVLLQFVENHQQPLTVTNQKITNCELIYFPNELSETNHLIAYIQNLIATGVGEAEICVLTEQQSSQYTEKLRSELSRKGIKNLDMTDLQDTLKEPLGVMFSLLFKLYVNNDPHSYTELCDYYLALNKVKHGDDKEEELTKQLSEHIYKQKSNIVGHQSADSIITLIKTSLKYFGIKKIKGRWKQYKSGEFFKFVWRNLELHLRNTINETQSLKDASLD